MSSADPARLRILYVGPLVPGNLTWLRCEALEDLGPEVVRFDSRPFPGDDRASIPVRAIRRYAPRLLLGPINRSFVAAVEKSHPDVVYVDKGIYLTPAALRRALAVRGRSGRRPVLLHFHPDDAFHPLIYHALYEKTLALYDCHFLPHRWVIEQHVARGAKRVEYWPFGYHPSVHSPVSPAERDPSAFAADTAFVGRWEKGRAEDLERLAREGFGLGIWGTQWERLAPGSPLRRGARFRPVVGRDLAAVATFSKISLGFLSDTNRDGHTSRTFEIPACGGFMLAQRSSGQLEFFEEGREIECFASFGEMRDKMRFYLDHETARERIREAGLERCRESGYSYQERFRFLLKVAGECMESVAPA